MERIPGFVDLQVNGYKGVDFSDQSLTEESFIEACRDLLDQGTAAFLPTIITSSEETYEHNLGIMGKALERPEFLGRLPGLHLEGPFLCNQPGAIGAHDPRHVQAPSIEFFEKLRTWSGNKIRMITLAAEADGAETLARYAVERGVTVSLGHHLASEADLDRLTRAGATALTHLGNGMPNILPRHLNPLFAGLAADGLTAMIISDGHHLPPGVLKTILRAKGVDKTVITSDASPVSGMPPGIYSACGNLCILEKNGRLHNPEKGCLVGSSATMLQCMNYLASLKLLTLEQLIQVGYYNPLRLIHVAPESIQSQIPLVHDEQSGRFIFAR